MRFDVSAFCLFPVRLTSTLMLTALSIMTIANPQTGFAQPCSGPYCLENAQITCPQNGTTTLTGTVYAPNGVDPLPNVMVYIPDGPPDATGSGTFAPGVSCQLPGDAPSGFPLMGTATRYDGKFTLTNVPVTANLQVVIQAGRWRRIIPIPTITGCSVNTQNLYMPRNQGEGDIPKIALTTGSADKLECVLNKMGIDDAEVTDYTGTGRINLFLGSATNGNGGSAAGANAGSNTATQADLMGNAALLNQYDVVMFACQATEYPKVKDLSTETSAMRKNLLDYANAGGRVFATHLEYGWLSTNGPFAGTASWTNKSATPSVQTQTGYINTTFPGGKTLSQWLQLVGASTTYGQMSLAQVRLDTTGIIAPTQLWMKIADNTPMQFTFNTPLNQPAGQQCGRILYNDYHVEAGSGAGKTYPAECNTTAAMTPQEKLLEYSLFDLSGNGAAPSLSPDTADFGRSAVSVQTASKTFTWTNSTVFPISVTSVTADADFVVTSDTCTNINVPASGTCTIAVAFKPTALGARTGTVNVNYSGTSSIANLTGTGVPDLESIPATLEFGKMDVGFTSSAQFVTVANNTPYDIALNPIVITGDYVQTSNCVGVIPANTSCEIDISFRPQSTGSLPGLMTLSAVDPSHGSISAAMTGTGVDFLISVSPESGSTIAGYPTKTSVTLSPLAGYSGNVTLSCTTDAVASTCEPAIKSLNLNATTTLGVKITTTPEYTVIGYQGLGGGMLFTLLGAGGGFLLWLKRRDTHGVIRSAVFVLTMSILGTDITGCSGKLPDKNPAYTAPGNYTYTITATDGLLSHSATFKLKVTVK